jgi:hypothetical protein
MKTNTWTKPKWIKPKLVVLVKGRPEEAVLTICKYTRQTGPSRTNCSSTFIGNCSTSSKS